MFCVSLMRRKRILIKLVKFTESQSIHAREVEALRLNRGRLTEDILLESFLGHFGEY